MGLRAVLRAVSGLERLRNTRVVALTRSNSTAPVIEASKEWDAALPFHEIPGPKPFPIVGNAWRFVPLIGDYAHMGFTDTNRKLFSEFGKIVSLSGIPGRQPTIMVFDPNDIEKVFRNDGIWPIREGFSSFEYYRKVTRRKLYEGACGLVSTQGDEWGKFRSSVSQPMLQPRAAKQYLPAIADVTDDFMKRIYYIRDENKEMPADFVDELYRWSLESISMIALDIRLGCLENHLASNSEPQQMIDSVGNLLDCLFKLNFGSAPMWRVIATPTWNRFVKHLDRMAKIVTKYVNLKLERMKTMPADPDRQLSVLEQILARNPNPNVAAVMALDMLLGGIDTTSHTVAILWHHLATHPDKQKILQAEIDNVLPSKKEPLVPEKVENLKYLKACIKESMRICSIAIGNRRTAGNDIVLQGYRIPKGTDIFMNNFIMCGMEEYFPQADKFIPERWLKGHPLNDDKPHPFVFLPFGFGPRMCIGRRLVEVEILTATTKIMQNFTLEWHHGPLKIKSALINSCASPLRFKMIDR